MLITFLKISDECLNDNGGCDHYCHNIIGGFYCSCRPEYVLDTDRKICTVECANLVFNDPSGAFETPDYPGRYPKNSDCDWTIMVQEGLFIHLVFDDFDVEIHPDVVCPYDFVKILSGNQVYGPFCGESEENNLPAVIRSTGNTMKVMFHSDASEEFRGFRAMYHATGPPCLPLEAPVYGEMAVRYGPLKQSVWFTCNPGYYLVGPESIFCTLNGTWSGVQPYCKIVDCGRPEDIDNGRFTTTNDNFTYTNAVVYSCDDYYEIVGSSVRFCETDGLWSDSRPHCEPSPPCPLPEAPVYGEMAVRYGPLKQSVWFTCNPGYYLVGPKSIFCTLNGTWSGVQPYCKIKDCGRPEDIDNGHFTTTNDNFTYTNAVVYTCDDYYEIVGSSVRFCETDGLWSNSRPHCEPICGNSTVPPKTRPHDRIVDGRTVAEGSWPWMALLDIPTQTFKICGGSLLNEEWLITTAQCVTNRLRSSETFGQVIPLRSINVTFGVHRRSQPTEHVQQRGVSEILRHPDYDNLNLDADIALLRLESPVNFTDDVRPICLPKSETVLVNDSGLHEHVERALPPPPELAVITGWGTVSDHYSTDVLSEAYLEIVEQTTCREAYHWPVREAYHWPVTDNMFCAGYKKGGKDTCRSDRGSPLMFLDESNLRYFVYGAFSWGRPDGCAKNDSYGVYSKFGNYASWIKENIKLPR
ncbi:mannan-binding lectin serine protease 1-like [Ptychodera flava]|uniref:mannan-binding lectin serine protease 1-like n=1 Tax=Ptychodera flava TaxID=63121 RepID=UPI00396A773B